MHFPLNFEYVQCLFGAPWNARNWDNRQCSKSFAIHCKVTFVYICIFIIYCILKIVPDDTIQKVCSCLLASFWPWVLPVLLGFLAGVLEFLFVQQPPLARSFLKRPNSVISEYHAAALRQHAKASEKYDICWRFRAYIIILLHAAYRSRHYPALSGPISYLRGTQTLSLLTDLTVTGFGGRFCEVSLQASHKGGSHEDEACSALLRWLSTCSVRRCNTIHYQATEMQYLQIRSNYIDQISDIRYLQSLRLCLNQCSLLMLLSGQNTSEMQLLEAQRLTRQMKVSETLKDVAHISGI